LIRGQRRLSLLWQCSRTAARRGEGGERPGAGAAGQGAREVPAAPRKASLGRCIQCPLQHCDGWAGMSDAYRAGCDAQPILPQPCRYFPNAATTARPRAFPTNVHTGRFKNSTHIARLRRIGPVKTYCGWCAECISRLCPCRPRNSLCRLGYVRTSRSNLAFCTAPVRVVRHTSVPIYRRRRAGAARCSRLRKRRPLCSMRQA
jgi:hypothetical protein